MPVTLHAKSDDAAVRHQREATAQRVIDYFGDRLPPTRLLCFLDDNNSGRLRSERGRYEAIHDGTPLAHLPDYVSERIYVDDHVSFYFPRVIDGLVFLYGRKRELPSVNLFRNTRYEVFPQPSRSRRVPRHVG
jgi:hypothetical protein